MLDNIPRSPYYEAPRRTPAELEYMARRLFPVWRALTHRGSPADTPGQWDALIRATAPSDLQAAQHWDDVTSIDADVVFERMRQFERDGRELGAALSKVVSIDTRTVASGIEIVVELNGAPYRTEIVETAAAAQARLTAVRNEMTARHHWQPVAPKIHIPKT